MPCAKLSWPLLVSDRLVVAVLEESSFSFRTPETDTKLRTL